jgi:hypothetical protein
LLASIGGSTVFFCLNRDGSSPASRITRRAHRGSFAWYFLLPGIR